MRFDRHDEDNPGWFYGAAPDGVEGYFPAAWFDVDEAARVATARRDYDAMELTLDAGTEVVVLVEESGWVRVRTREGDEGWVPKACVGE